jgi:acetoin utilization deacetylase AcuC-like enzyme
VRVFYSPRYEVSLPGHVWPTAKYRLIAERLGCGGPAGGSRPPGLTFVEPPLASWDDLALVHSAEYLAKLRGGTLTADEIATLELPWMPEFADTFRLMAGGTCAAAGAALQDGCAAHLGGGLHHAFAGHGEGFCPVNDVAIAIRVLQRDRRIRSAAVVDLDVHHGNGTAMIFESDPDVFTFSMHQQHNYPFFKPRGDLDIGLEDGVRDERYLGLLRGALPRVMESRESRPELIVYVAGADPYEQDRLGGLKLTKTGLAERDRLVVEAARSAGVPLVTVLAGGYAVDVQDTVDIQVTTVKAMVDRQQ